MNMHRSRWTVVCNVFWQLIGGICERIFKRSRWDNFGTFKSSTFWALTALMNVAPYAESAIWIIWPFSTSFSSPLARWMIKTWFFIMSCRIHKKTNLKFKQELRRSDYARHAVKRLSESFWNFQGFALIQFFCVIFIKSLHSRHTCRKA